jgi:drug/metabolite transporter (DMT)-like permease
VLSAIYNTNAFFSYVFTVKFLHLPWDSRRLLAVLIATLGVVVVVYGGSFQPDSAESDKSIIQAKVSTKPSAPLVGDLLTLVASVACGLYQVFYKKYAALPSDPELIGEENHYRPIIDDYAEINPSEATSLAESVKEDIVYPPPFGLHPNLLVSFAGLLTFMILWIPLPLLHYSGIERFKLPGNLTTSIAIAGIASSGIIFNAGFTVRAI